MSDIDRFLRVPHTLTVESLELADGSWVRRVSYKALAGCSEQGTDLDQMIEQVEVQRIRAIADGADRGAEDVNAVTLLEQPASLLTRAEIDQVLKDRDSRPSEHLTEERDD